jgi:putative ABC transport system permease protein
MLVRVLAGVFDPPPETIVVPFGYLTVTIIGTAVVAGAVVVAVGRAHARTEPAALKLE